jgi:VIT1/CCC1 family predicted Fe2+/Mn2+ transporter
VNSIVVKRVSFTSHVWVSAVSFVVVGVLLGVATFIGSLFGLPVENELFGRELHGVQAGAVSVALGPLVLGILGAITGALSYLPFSAALRLFRGIRIHGEFEP